MVKENKEHQHWQADELLLSTVRRKSSCPLSSFLRLNLLPFFLAFDFAMLHLRNAMDTPKYMVIVRSPMDLPLQ